MCACESHWKKDVRCTCVCPEHEYIRKHYAELDAWEESHADKPVCHCGKPVMYGFDGDPTHHRGMCEFCDAVRCDAYPGACVVPLTPAGIE